MKIIAVGDVVGRPGRLLLKRLLPRVVSREGADFVVVNAENAAGGSGITPDVAEELLALDVDVYTSGDHIWKRKGVEAVLSSERRILRPANYPPQDPGSGAVILQSSAGVKVGILNLLGRVFMNSVDCPFRVARREVEKLRVETPVIIVDMHAEATSEKIAISRFLDGSVSAVVGTHTHVQTADEKVSSKGTAYITDLGMTGPLDSVLGRDAGSVVESFLTCMPMRFDVASDDLQLQGVVIEVDEKTGRACSIRRLQERETG